MKFKAIEVRTPTVAAQVIVEDGEDENEVFDKAFAWCQEKTQATIPAPEPEAVDPELLKSQIEQDVKKNLLEHLLKDLERPDGTKSELVEAATDDLNNIYDERQQMENPLPPVV